MFVHRVLTVGYHPRYSGILSGHGKFNVHYGGLVELYGKCFSQHENLSLSS